MNDILKPSIDSRKQALFSAYDIQDPGNLKTIEDYFKRLEEFAKDYNDVMAFETAFASSPLCKEYSDLFVQIMNTERTVDGQAPVVDVPEEYTLHDEIKDDMERAVRRRARQDAYNAARDVPILGEAMTAKQHFDFFNRFRKKKDD
jgi:hypothetical protein